MSVKPLLNALQDQGFRMTPDLYRKALELAGEWLSVTRACSFTPGGGSQLGRRSVFANRRLVGRRHLQPLPPLRSRVAGTRTAENTLALVAIELLPRRWFRRCQTWRRSHMAALTGGRSLFARKPESELVPVWVPRTAPGGR